MKNTKIGWTNHSWNAVLGCSHVSEGCRFCYAERISLKFQLTPKEWTAKNASENVILKPHRMNDPRKLKEPSLIFVNSMSDFFHEQIPDDYLNQMMGVMKETPQHTYQVLTKRPQRMVEYLINKDLPNHIWWGVSIEEARHLSRMDALREVPCKVRFISFEPLLEDLGELDLSGIAWAIVGGESDEQGRFRPMDHAWARKIRDCCVEQGVEFFFKQSSDYRSEKGAELMETDGRTTTWRYYPVDGMRYEDSQFILPMASPPTDGVNEIIEHKRIHEITVNDRLRRKIKLEKVAGLAAAISLEGFTVPILINKDGSLIAGNHRLEAVKQLGWTHIPVIVKDVDPLMARLIEIDENIQRNELDALDQGKHLVERDEVLRKMGLRAEVGQGRPLKNSEESSPFLTTEEIAAQVGMSERIAQQRKQIYRSLSEDVREEFEGTPLADRVTDLLHLAQADSEQIDDLRKQTPDLWEGLKAGELTTTQAFREYRRRTLPVPAPIEGTYRVWYADPPWQYRQTGYHDMSPAERHYPTMTIEALCEMGEMIKERAEENAVLFLWVTAPILPGAFPVIEAWGFTYKSCLIWDKSASVFGNYLDVRHEMLLICTRGSCIPDMQEKKFASVMAIPRSNRHSEKPAFFREMIDTLYPHGNRIELFARQNIPGWDSYGAEVTRETASTI
jgi:protein gp37/N6-adenosine-specific RNA methylase IME4